MASPSLHLPRWRIEYFKMHMTFFMRSILGALALGALPFTALAADAGPYVSFSGMFVLSDDSDFTEPVRGGGRDLERSH